MKCNLCPRQCNIDRALTPGYCGTSDCYRIARYSLHAWEEPCISGSNGSGTIFFSGCNLGCIFCQNEDIAHRSVGKDITEDELIDIMHKLQSHGAHNINLVTPSHYADKLSCTIRKAKQSGITIPFVYNTSSYDSLDAIKSLDGLIDIYLPDFKYLSEDIALKFSKAKDYPSVASKVLDEMIRQTGKVSINEESGLVTNGTIVRHLILPQHTSESKKVLEYLYKTYSDDIFISIMNQYTPPKKELSFSELNRKLTTREYNLVVDYALSIGITNAFIQDGEASSESFIPAFSNAISTNI